MDDILFYATNEYRYIRDETLKMLSRTIAYFHVERFSLQGRALYLGFAIFGLGTLAFYIAPYVLLLYTNIHAR